MKTEPKLIKVKLNRDHFHQGLLIPKGATVEMPEDIVSDLNASMQRAEKSPVFEIEGGATAGKAKPN